jgi:hypothetical protein
MIDPSLYKQTVLDWISISDEHRIYVADVGLSVADCDHLVRLAEHSCRGQYAAYTYAKQTLGCRDYPSLARACQDAVHAIVYAIQARDAGKELTLDDREPHMVKYGTYFGCPC